ncbi:UNVERIFIED_CONTAM: hypothetical protein Slati_4609900 [Sesamum latifolium]|uniref:Integrase catalytic domain-containing protein n=1 Tax=Sesamum latifolium TaxID=2727402 RepID=A0AAW2RR42_9LAMI
MVKDCERSLANYTRTSFTNHRSPYILQSPNGRLMHGDLMSWGLSLLSHLHIYILAAADYSSRSFKQHNSSMYNAAANGLAEAVNKTLCNLLKKVVSKSKRDWHEKIGKALWAYRTTHRTATQATPYSLVYGVEVVLPLESQIPSLRIAIQEGLTAEDNARLRLEELEALDEKRLEAQ